MKQRIAVIFGGRSPEHDVSITTGLQVLKAIDQQRFDAFPVYISPDGGWWIGSPLWDQNTFIPRGAIWNSLESVTLDIAANVDGKGALIHRNSGGIFRKLKKEEFDVALIALHGLAGEDGRIQGLLEIANVPYTGVRQFGCGICMDKAATKVALRSLGIPLLQHVVIDRPATGLMYSAQELEARSASIHFPVVAKPLRLGSSIGVSRANNIEELRAALSVIFRMDGQAILEPLVENLVEYNVAVRRANGVIITSAIERPKRSEELLDFKSKYMSGGVKSPGDYSEGLLALTRDINPDLPVQVDENIRNWAAVCFDAICKTGAPRIDFLANEITGDIWLNEVNPCPGSFAFFLWSACREPILFTELLTQLIHEAGSAHREQQYAPDMTPMDARLFPRD